MSNNNYFLSKNNISIYFYTYLISILYKNKFSISNKIFYFNIKFNNLLNKIN